jgi:hypothetical protein
MIRVFGKNNVRVTSSGIHSIILQENLFENTGYDVNNVLELLERHFQHKGDKIMEREKEIPERRSFKREPISTPIKVRFKLEYEGEIIDISRDGLGLKYHPLGTHALNVGKPLNVQIDMNGKIVSLHGSIRQVSEKFGYIVLGLQYDRNEIALFDL